MTHAQQVSGRMLDVAPARAHALAGQRAPLRHRVYLVGFTSKITTMISRTVKSRLHHALRALRQTSHKRSGHELIIGQSRHDFWDTTNAGITGCAASPDCSIRYGLASVAAGGG